MSQNLIEFYRIKVLLSITYLSYLLLENSHHIFTCDIWVIGFFRVISRLPWIFPILNEKDSTKYQICIIPFSLVLNAVLLFRKHEELKYCEQCGDLETAIYFETYMAVALYALFMISVCVSQIIYNNKNYYDNDNDNDMKLISISFITVSKWNQTDRMCCICYDDFTVNDQLAFIQCGHYDHVNCMNEWIKKSKSCPRCKQTIL